MFDLPFGGVVGGAVVVTTGAGKEIDSTAEFAH